METKQKILKAKEIADDVQQTYPEVTNEYRKLLEDRIVNLYTCADEVTNLIGKLTEQIFPSKLYSNKTIPEKGKRYMVIVQLDREWEIIEVIGEYRNEGWFDFDGKKLVKVIAWK